MARARSKDTSSTVEHVLEYCRILYRARSKYTQSLVYFDPYISTPNHPTSCTVKACLGDGGKTHVARWKYTSSNVDTSLELGENIPRTFSKHTSSTVETCLEHGRNKLRARSNHHRARSKCNLSTVKKHLEHCRIIPRAQSENTSSTVETYLEHGRNLSQERSKHTQARSKQTFGLVHRALSKSISSTF